MSSTRGVFVPEGARETEKVRRCISGKSVVDVSDVDASIDAAAAADVKVGGAGASETLMTCSKPERCIPSMTSLLKKSRSRDLSCMKRGCVSNSSEAKCMSGR